MAAAINPTAIQRDLPKIEMAGESSPGIQNLLPTMPRPLAIHHGVSHLTVSEPELIALFTALDAWPAYALPPGELSIAFLSDDALAEVHRAFLDDPELTDVITFPGTSPEDHPPDACDTMGEEFQEAGEICVSVDMAIRVAITGRK